MLELARNLLHLELIARTKQTNCAFDFTQILDAIDLWHHYREALIQRENILSNRQGDRMIAEAAALAKASLNSPERTVLVDPMSPTQARLVSSEILVKFQGRVHRFRHEQLQDYLYAWDAVERGFLPHEVVGEIPAHRTRNVIAFMASIYARNKNPGHLAFLKGAFGV